MKFVAAAVMAAALDARAVAQSPAPFLFQVDGPKARHYLLGSVHMLPESAYPLPPALEQAYVATKGIVFESDLGALSSPDLQGKLLGAAKEDRPGGLKASLGKALYARLQKRATQLGMPTPACEGMRAWFCAMMLELYPMQLAGYQAELGLDQHFYAKALEDGRTAGWLETPETQLNLFVDMPDAMSTKFLAATLDDMTEGSLGPDEMLKAWRSGDHAAMEKLVKDLKAKYPDVYARLIADRNKAWLPKLVERLSGSDPQLVIVGAAHLEGPDGLVALLKAQNMAVAPVTAPLTAAFAPAARVESRSAPSHLSWALGVPEVEAAKSFYERAFGFETLDSQKDEQNKLQYARMAGRGAALLLISDSRAKAQPAPAGAPTSLYLYVDDVDSFVARAKAAGAEVVEAPSVRAWGDRVAVIRDPEGHSWMFAQCALGSCQPELKSRAPDSGR